MKFKVEILEDLAYNMLDENDGVKIIEREYRDSGRWTEHWRMVFAYGDKYYAADYELPSTEMQEIDPFEYSVDVNGYVDCNEVVPEEKTITVYREV